MNVERAAAIWQEVVVVNCGGTINMDGGAGAAPGEGVRRLFARLGGSFDRSRLRLVTPFARPPDSSNVGAAEWETMVAQVRAIDAQKRVAGDALEAAGRSRHHRGGVVVAHGTDTMQVTSMVAALELAAGGLIAPVVFTGAHSPPDVEGSDAIHNLAKAVFAAMRRPEEMPHNLPPGVYVLIGEDIHLASRLTKLRSHPDPDGRYFFSSPGPVAQMTSKDFSVKLNQGLLDQMVQGRPTGALPRRTGPWGYVEHLVLDAFCDPGILDDVLRRCRVVRAARPGRGAGVVIQGDFRSHAALSRLLDGLSALLADDVVVVMGSREAARALAAQRGGAAPCVVPRSLSHGAARLKLSWLLGTDAPRAWMGALLATSLVGEVFETHALPGWIKYETFPDQRPGVVVVPAWPDLPAQVVADAAARVRRARPHGGVLHLYGFGYGHIPGPNRSIGELVAERLAALDLPGGADLLAGGLPDGLAEVLGVVSGFLGDASPSALGAALDPHLRVEPRLGAQALRSALARRVQDQLRSDLGAQLSTVLGDFSAGEAGAEIRRADPAVAALLGELRFRLDPARLERARRAALEARGLPGDAPLLWQLCVVAPEVVARRLIKDAIMASTLLLGAVGRAVDAGVRVEIHSLAARSPTDASRYEAGTLLLALGVKAEEGPWWRDEGLRAT